MIQNKLSRLPLARRVMINRLKIKVEKTKDQNTSNQQKNQPLGHDYHNIRYSVYSKAPSEQAVPSSTSSSSDFLTESGVTGGCNEDVKQPTQQRCSSLSDMSPPMNTQSRKLYGGGCIIDNSSVNPPFPQLPFCFSHTHLPQPSQSVSSSFCHYPNQSPAATNNNNNPFQQLSLPSKFCFFILYFLLHRLLTNT